MFRFQPVKTTFILGIILIMFLFALPNALPEKVRAAMPGWLPHQTVNLGLDLRGGSHLLFEVQMADVYKLRMQSLEDDIRKEFNKNHIGYTGLRSTVDAKTGDSRAFVALRDPAQGDDAVKRVKGLAQSVGGGTMGIGGQADINVSIDSGGRITAVLTDEAKKGLQTSTVNQSIEVVRNRIDQMGAKEPIIQRQGTNRIVVEVPGESDPEHIKSMISKTARLTFQGEDTTVSLQDAKAGRTPPRSKIYQFQDPKGEGGQAEILLEERIVISGEQLRNATIGTDPQTGAPAVDFTLNTSGAKRFADFSSNNIGRRFAIVLDDKVISAPVIRSAIVGGSGQISGGYKSMQDAQDLAVLLRAGALPASLAAVEQRTIGPELGVDSIHAGVLAAIIGSVAVVVFMLLAYGQFGIIANIALVANVIIILGVITLLRATLTLPGIAGIVLTIGMAVDSNVLIYERIKEELRGGKGMLAAIETGFTRAFATILDANLTTLLASLILFQLGAGPVRGFAIAHAVGTLTTIFTAYTFSRLLVAAWVRLFKPKRVPIDPRPLPNGKQPFHLIPLHFKLPFMRTHMIGFIVSAVAAIASIVLPFLEPLNFSIDFKGGTAIEIKTTGPANIGKIRSITERLVEHGTQVQEFGAPDDVQVRFANQGDGSAVLQAAAREKITNALTQGLGQKFNVAGIDVVGPQVGEELKQKGIIAVLLGIGLMMVYIWFRFEWQFGVGAVVGLFHDILLTVGIFSLFQIEFNVSIIAALLTIVGYSMNDKVVIYDRVRENLRKYKKMEIHELIDLSLNETLSRTTITAITTLLALFSLYFFGGHVIRNFVFAMIWGVFVGTYSSLYISAPFLLYVGVKRDWSQLAKTAAKAGA